MMAGESESSIQVKSMGIVSEVPGVEVDFLASQFLSFVIDPCEDFSGASITAMFGVSDEIVDI
jgi:hypothetical protein